MTSSQTPEALLLIGPGCPHCSALLEVLSGMVKSGVISRLVIVNVAQQPERARQLGVRSVPWLRLGVFELQGAYTEGEIKQWLNRLQSPEGKSLYLQELLQEGKLDKVISIASGDAEKLRALLRLAAREELDIKVQLGISAVFEELQGEQQLAEVINDIGALAQSGNPRIRADAAHFLALTESELAVPYLQQLAKDHQADVRGIAAEALAERTSR